MGVVGFQECIKWLAECDKDQIPKVGGKNSNLGEMIKADLPVPPGFVVTVDAYQQALSEANLREKIMETLSGLDTKDTRTVEKVSQDIRSLIEKLAMRPELEKEIEKRYTSLCHQCGVSEIPVAVRSSATAEDLPEASFAGQQDTYLWIKKKNLTKAIVRCWASLFTSRAICYRAKMGVPHEEVDISVGIQTMVDAQKAGVMFTMNPINNDRTKIVVEGSWGLGESVVAGDVTPDEWVVDKVVMEISSRRISPKLIKRMVDSSSQEVVTVDVPLDKQEVPCLNDEEILEIAKLGKRIEQHYDWPQDIEWAISKQLYFPENIFILQTRPETTEHKVGAKLRSTGDSKMDVIQFWKNLKA